MYCMETLGHRAHVEVFGWVCRLAGMHEAFIEVLVHPVLCDPEVTFIKEEKTILLTCLSCVYFSGAVDLIKYTKAAEAHGSLVS